MAKLKTTDTGDGTPTPDIISPASDGNTANQSEPASEPKVDKPDETVQGNSKLKPNIPPFVSKILKAFRAYAQLYIDTHGSAYTPDTPEKLRPGALLYQNPFYEP